VEAIASMARRRRWRGSTIRTIPGALPNGSKRYQLRARFGDSVVDLDDPYGFRLSWRFRSLSARRRHPSAHLDKLGAIRYAGWRRGIAFVVLAPTRAGQRGRDFNFWNARRTRSVRARLLGLFIRTPVPATTTSSTSSRATASIWR